MIRSLHPNDLDKLRELHAQHFGHESDFPEFLKFICAFVVEDESGIITAGGIRSIPECILVTDLSRDPKSRAKALYQMLDASKFVCNRMGYDRMYAWSQNPTYARRLIRTGFRLPQGQSLVLDL